MITFDKENEIFYLNTKSTTYAMVVNSGKLFHRYWGKRLVNPLDKTDLSDYLTRNAEKCGMSKEDIFKSVTVTSASLPNGKTNKGYLKVGDKADIAVFKIIRDSINLTDRYNNAIIIDKSYKCVFTVKESKVSLN